VSFIATTTLHTLQKTTRRILSHSAILSAPDSQCRGNKVEKCSGVSTWMLMEIDIAV
jgi:hypothetical protein